AGRELGGGVGELLGGLINSVDVWHRKPSDWDAACIPSLGEGQGTPAGCSPGRLVAASPSPYPPWVDPERRYRALLEQIRREFPRFRLIRKDASLLQRSIHLALAVLTLGGQRH